MKKMSLFWNLCLFLLLLPLIGCTSSIDELEARGDVNGLIEKLKSNDPMICVEACSALKRIGEPAVDKLILFFEGQKNDLARKEVATTLGDIGDKRATEPLISAVNVIDLSVRLAVIGALGNIKDKRASEPLVSKLNDADYRVRSLVVEALGKIDGEKFAEHLIRALQDNSEEVRIAAIYSLERIDENLVVEPLILALKDESEKVRIAAIYSLGNMEYVRNFAPLTVVSALKDRSDNVRFAAAKALGNINDRRVIGPLTAALNDVRDKVRLAAVNSLGNMDRPEVIKPLLSALGNDDINVEIAAIEHLGNKDDERVIVPLIRALKSNDSICDDRDNKAARAALVKIGKPAVSHLIAEIKTQSKLHLGVAGVLGEIGDQKDLLILEKYLVDWRLKKDIAEILDSSAWRPNTTAEKIHFWVAAGKVDLIKENWETAKEVLVKELDSKNKALSQYAAYALISLGQDDTVPILIHKLHKGRDLALAKAYLNSGNEKLYESAERLAHLLDMEIHTTIHGTVPATWGSL